MNKEFWKTAVKYLMTILLTGLFAWFAFGIDSVSRGEYRQDFAAQDFKFESCKKETDRKISINTKAIHGLQVQFAVIQQMLKQINDNVEEIKDRSD